MDDLKSEQDEHQHHKVVTEEEVLKNNDG